MTLPHVSSDAPQFSGHAEFDAYSGAAPVEPAQAEPAQVEPAPAEPAQVEPEAHPATGIMAAMGAEAQAPSSESSEQRSVPTAAFTPETPVDPAGAPEHQPAPPAPAAPAAQPQPYAAPAPAQHAAAAEQPARAVRPVPPSFRESASPADAPAAPGIRPAPLPPTAETSAPVAPAVDGAGQPGAVPAGAVPAGAVPAGAGLAGDVDKTVVSPRPTDDDLDATVVVARKRGVRRSLVLDDGRTFALSGASVVIGRNPIGDPGEQRLAISDTTRTLSKTHARLVVHEDEWRLTDLHATNGVVVVEENGTETLLDPGESVTGNGRFILGEVGMHVVAERDS